MDANAATLQFQLRLSRSAFDLCTYTQARRACTPCKRTGLPSVDWSFCPGCCEMFHALTCRAMSLVGEEHKFQLDKAVGEDRSWALGPPNRNYVPKSWRYQMLFVLIRFLIEVTSTAQTYHDMQGQTAYPTWSKKPAVNTDVCISHQASNQPHLCLHGDHTLQEYNLQLHSGLPQWQCMVRLWSLWALMAGMCGIRHGSLCINCLGAFVWNQTVKGSHGTGEFISFGSTRWKWLRWLIE